MSTPRPRVSHSVGIAELKARLSEAIRWVRHGEAITVFDRNMPVASIVPIEHGGGGLVVRPARPGEKPQDVRLPPPLGNLGSLEALRDERKERL